MQYGVVSAGGGLETVVPHDRYAANAAPREFAERYPGATVTYCEGFRDFPHGGTRRDDVRPGLRITNYRKRAVIAFDVNGAQVSIIGVFYGGQDHESVLQSELDD